MKPPGSCVKVRITDDVQVRRRKGAKVRIALAQLNPTIGDLQGNAERMVRFIATAKEGGADLVVFPELSLPGYTPQDLLLLPDFVQACRAVLEDVLAPATRGIGALVGLPLSGARLAPHLFNAAVLVADGEVVGVQAKTLLPTYDVFFENRYFQPAPRRTPLCFRGVNLGVTICEDVWNDKSFWEDRRYPLDPVEELVGGGAEIIINISGSPYSFGKQTLRLNMVRALARHQQRAVVYVNQVGGNDDLLYDGSSFAVGPQGELLARCRSFVEDLAYVDLGAGAGDGTLRVEPFPTEDISWVHQALVMGIRDYCRKAGLKRALVGLSGGVDSALVAVLAAEALGPENVKCLSMPSRYSSTGSVADAATLAHNLGVEYVVKPIEKVFSALLADMNEGGPLHLDVAEENAQARIRGNFLMFISNRENRLLLTTGNKSELAVGYATLYGDMAGGLAVIGDVPKTMVYELCRHINALRPELIPTPILTKAPSAELRPGQKDTDSLPPYPLLDFVLRKFVEENHSLEEIVTLLAADAGVPAELVASFLRAGRQQNPPAGSTEAAAARKISELTACVERILRLVAHAEYKRRQAPPILRITSRHFGDGRRMPIAQRWSGRIAP